MPPTQIAVIPGIVIAREKKRYFMSAIETAALTSLIRSRIQEEGPISFRDFMEMALYQPEQGYYTSCSEKLGKKGDYYTSPYLTKLFGWMVALQMEEMWQLMDCPAFTIIEYGAGTGLLCRDILSRLQQNQRMYEQLDYVIVEKNAGVRQRLPEKARWVESAADLSPITGCVLSNELLDNFSVHQVVMEDELMEVCVDYQEGFIEVMRPASPLLKDYLTQLNVALPKGYRAEIDLEAAEWIQTVGAILEKGFVLTIDYGYPSSGLYSRKDGTLVCYHQHKVNYDPYQHIGEQDITHHVNFSALDWWGRKAGLVCCGYTNQGWFLQGMGLTRCLQEMERDHQLSAGEGLWQMRTLLLEMGHRFKVLIQRKGVEKVFLSGLQFPQVLE